MCSSKIEKLKYSSNTICFGLIIMPLRNKHVDARHVCHSCCMPTTTVSQNTFNMCTQIEKMSMVLPRLQSVYKGRFTPVL